MAWRCLNRVAVCLATAIVLFDVMAVSAGESAPSAVTEGDGVSSASRRRQIQPLIYHVDENLPVGSLIGDLRADMRSVCDDDDCDDVATRRFSLLHQRPAGTQLFNVHQTSGVLRSAGEVDREEICFRREVVCTVVLEVAVHYAAADAFDVAVVEVSDTAVQCYLCRV